jgi:inorganic pyrophosphatase
MNRKQIKERLMSMLGSKITMYVDRPINSIHPKHKDIIYEVNYGYIKEIIALDGEYQDAYLLGVEQEVKCYEGIVCAIVERENDNEDKLIVVPEGLDFTTKAIEEKIDFQEKFFKYKIIK